MKSMEAGWNLCTSLLLSTVHWKLLSVFLQYYGRLHQSRSGNHCKTFALCNHMSPEFFVISGSCIRFDLPGIVNQWTQRCLPKPTDQPTRQATVKPTSIPTLGLFSSMQNLSRSWESRGQPETLAYEWRTEGILYRYSCAMLFRCDVLWYVSCWLQELC